MTKVKICGITNVPDAIAATNAGADFIGLVLSPSPRRADIAKVKSIASAVAGRAHTVGVFASEANLLEYDRETDCPLDYYQVYFDYHCLPVRQPKRDWIRSFWITDTGNVPTFDQSGLFLCDFKNTSVDLVHRLYSAFPDMVQQQTFIAGNLTVENVGAVVSAFRPFGIDVARGTELTPGVKDIGKMEQFIQRVKNA
jgi:phosphoribosylanthranilate isomerase